MKILSVWPSGSGTLQGVFGYEKLGQGLGFGIERDTLGK